MPVILKKERVGNDVVGPYGIGGGTLLELLLPYPDEEMMAYTVSPMVNQVANDCTFPVIRKTMPMDQFGNYTLFG
jgi:hypothetical protein